MAARLEPGGVKEKDETNGGTAAESVERCFAYEMGVNGKWMCKALESACTDGKNTLCSFYKTRDKHFGDRTEGYRRIAALEWEDQRAISDKYYKSRMPWGEYIADRGKTCVHEDVQEGTEGTAEKPAPVH